MIVMQTCVPGEGMNMESIKPRTAILNKGAPELSFYGSKKSARMDARERKLLRRQQILDKIDAIQDSAFAEYESLENKRTQVGYYLLTLHNEYNALKDLIHPLWRSEVNK